MATIETQDDYYVLMILDACCDDIDRVTDVAAATSATSPDQWSCSADHCYDQSYS